jgi:hypothetical protein
MTAGQSHATSIVVNASPRRVFAFMADPEKLPRWSFGTWTIERLEGDIVRGTSLFDGSTILVRIVPDAACLAIDYHLGQDQAKMEPRIMVRVVPGPTVGLGEDVCVLTFLAWRSAAMDDDRWRRLTASHELEVVLIKSMLESGIA